MGNKGMCIYEEDDNNDEDDGDGDKDGLGDDDDDDNDDDGDDKGDDDYDDDDDDYTLSRWQLHGDNRTMRRRGHHGSDQWVA